MKKGYTAVTQTEKNLAWFLPRPKPDRYKGGMPLYCEDWLIALAKDLLQKPDATILNVFCGMNKHGKRVDIREEVKPDICCDVHNLTQYIQETFDIILADPPYSNKEAKDLYGTPPLKYKKWTAECEKLLNPGGVFIVYHKFVVPNPNPDKLLLKKRVFIGNRTWHLPRVAIVYMKK